ncbi:hypothetical protein FKM82_011489 [Ascaphus truei]
MSGNQLCNTKSHRRTSLPCIPREQSAFFHVTQAQTEMKQSSLGASFVWIHLPPCLEVTLCAGCSLL